MPIQFDGFMDRVAGVSLWGSYSKTFAKQGNKVIVSNDGQGNYRNHPAVRVTWIANKTQEQGRATGSLITDVFQDGSVFPRLNRIRNLNVQI